MGALIQWLRSGGKAVLHNVAEERALTCATCPKNKRGTVRAFFTRPAAKLVHEQIERANERHLSTSVDPILGLCDACKCWIPVKVWAPKNIILANLKPKTKAKLWDECWILKL